MSILHRLLLLCLLALIPGALSLAQDDQPQHPRDVLDLARRYLGYNAPYAIPLPPPLYQQGETAQFWVGKKDSDEPVQISAVLAARTPSLYIWVEDGLTYDSQAMFTFAAQVDQMIAVLRDNFGQGTVIDGIGQVSSSEFLLPLPDVDNDPHVYVLFTSDLREDQETVINPNNSAPAQWVPGGFSNERELITINTSLYPGADIPADVYANVLLRAVHRFLSDSHTPDQAVWLEQALGWTLANELQISGDPNQSVSAFLNAPETPLLRPQTLTSGQQTRGAQILFVEYLRQRFGTAFIGSLFDQNRPGFSGISQALESSGIIDPLTGGGITAQEIFADFVMANGLNLLMGDGRFFYVPPQDSPAYINEGQTAAAQTLDRTDSSILENQIVPQFGTRYYYLPPATTPAALQLSFDGLQYASRLPFPAERDQQDMYYWSGREQGQDTTLTRRFDLTEVTEATLEFDVWYALTANWNYAYLSVSTNDGQTWAILPTALSSDTNSQGLSYGEGYTGISSTEQPRPFPALGIVIDSSDNMSVTEVVSGGAADRAGVRAGDLIIGYDGELWPVPPNILELLSHYAPGDTLNLLIQRGTDRLEIPVILAAHPTRIVFPQPVWITQQADLSQYAGQQILVRFEYISMPNTENDGFAVDNIRIPELNFSDSADEDGLWESAGFVRTDNLVDQPFLVQIATSGSPDHPPRVRHLITSTSLEKSGEWNFALQPQESLLIAVSGVNEDTTQPAAFSLSLRPIPASGSGS